MQHSAVLDDLLDLAGQPERLDEAIHAALDELGRLVPYDLAGYFECRDRALRLRLLRGPLAERARVAGQGLVLEPARLPSIERAFAAGGPKVLSAEEHEREGDPWDGVLDLAHGHSCLLLPVQAGGERLGLITLDRESCGVYEDPAVAVAGLMARILGQAVLFSRQAARLQELSAALEERGRALEGGASPAGEWLEACRAPAMVRLREQARRAAASDAPVLIAGETGTGKEVLARAIHAWSPRRERPFLAVNCAALPPQLAESELFGHLRGAFTGAVRDRPGLFAAVDGGSLLLDEVGELPPELQAKLLRVLQEGEVTPVGGERPRPVDLRILAASHVDLAAAVRAGRFREDLFFRLHVVPLLVPPLRERPEDVEQLAESVLADLSRRRGAVFRLARDARDWLPLQAWPGNIRQLRNALERATIFSADGWITRALLEEGVPPGAAATVPTAEVPRGFRPGGRAALSPAGRAGGAGPIAAAGLAEVARDAGTASPGSADLVRTPPDAPLPTLAEWEARFLAHALERSGGRIYGKGGAAAALGLKPTTLQSRLKKLGVRR
jgi:transcriptional regulator with GAF, ATPase, and Fis domain